MSVIEPGKGVIIRGSKNLNHVRASSGTQEFNRKISFNTNGLAGKRYGTAFEIKDDGSLEVVDALSVDKKDCEFRHRGTDIYYVNEPKDGHNKDDMVQKTKYVPQFIALKPTARLISQVHFNYWSDKMLNIQPNALAQILSWSNVHAESKVLVFEDCQGLIAGALLERLGTNGRLIQLYRGQAPFRHTMEEFNFSDERLEASLCSLRVEKIDMLQSWFDSGKTDGQILETILGKDIFNADKKDATYGGGNKERNQTVPEGLPSKKKRKMDKYNKKGAESKRFSAQNRALWLNESRNALVHLRRKDIDSLVIVCKYHPTKVLMTLLKLLPPSCPFVIYCPFKQPIMECYVSLKELNVAVDVQVTETWLRDIQVLTNRTHPMNVMSGTGGYLLHAIKVEP